MAKFYRWVGGAEVRDDYQKLHDSFKYGSVKVDYWKSFAPPDRVVFIFEGLT